MLTVHEVDARRFRDLERPFEARGGPKNCRCVVFRETPIGLLGHVAKKTFRPRARTNEADAS